MSFNYKNPITPITVLGNSSVPRTSIFGSDFSVLSTGGYMEVYNISDLYFTIPSGSTGLIEFSGNTIPIQFNKGLGTLFSPDVLTLNSDNISSGRRRLGMLAYVISEDQIYQYSIPNFETLWNAATGATGPGGNTVVFSEFGTTIKGNSSEGIAFISAWTSNAVDGISGETASTAVWKKFVPINFSATCIDEISINVLDSCDTGITLNKSILPYSSDTIDLGSNIKRFREINTLSGTSSYWESTVKVITPEVDLGLDSLGNSRILTADTSVLNNDILSGGTY